MADENFLAKLVREGAKNVFGTGAGSKAEAAAKYKEYVRKAQENGESYVTFDEYMKGKS